MKQITNNGFVKMCRQGILGAFLGIIAGLILGILIYLLQFPLIWINMLTYGDANVPGMPTQLWFSVLQPGTLGMSFGAVIGAIFGSISGLKNKRDE